jgi:putative transcriptional regulator
MDWQAFDALTDQEVIARATTDPDNKPLTKADLRRMRRRPRAYIVRRALHMTQEEFADAYRIPIGTLRDWEQGRTEPDQANRAYLRIIAFDPEFVKRALAPRPETQKGKARRKNVAGA